MHETGLRFVCFSFYFVCVFVTVYETTMNGCIYVYASYRGHTASLPGNAPKLSPKVGQIAQKYYMHEKINSFKIDHFAVTSLPVHMCILL